MPVALRSPSGPPARPRLVAAVEPAQGLVLLRGVPGSGRTTLAAAWFSRRQATRAAGGWVEGRAGYASENALSSAIASALGLELRGEGLDALAGALLDAPTPIDVVLDDADAYLDDSLRASLRSLVTRVPGLTLLVVARSSRGEPGAAVDLPSRELHATPVELARIVAETGIDLPRSATDEVHAWFGGWLRPSLAASRAWSASRAAGHSPDVARRAAQEVGIAAVTEASSSDADEQFLVELWLWQLAAELTPETASVALAQENPMPVILALEAEGAVEPIPGPRPRWRSTLGDVLSGALFSRLESERADSARAAHRRLSDFALAHGRPADAIRHAALSTDWEHTAALLHSQWATVLASDKAALREALNALPTEFTDRYPRWRQAKAYVQHMPLTGPARPVQFSSAPAGEATDLMDVLASSTARLAAARYAGRIREARSIVDDIEEILDDVGEDQLAPVLPALAELRTQWARAHFFSGAIGRARQEYEKTYDEAIAHDNVRIAVSAAGSLVLLHALIGRGEQAEAWISRTPEYRPADAPDTVHAVGSLGRALLALNRLDLDAAETLLLEDAQIIETSEYGGLQAAVRASVAGLRGHATAALHTLRAERSAAGERWTTGLNAVVLGVTEASLLILVGRYNDAARALEVEADDPGLVRILLSGRARTGLAAGYPAAAAADSRQALNSPDPSVRSLVEAHLVLAAVLAEEGDVEQARENARTAVDLATRHALPAALAGVSAADLDTVADDVPGELLERLLSLVLPRKARRPLPGLTPRERQILGQIVAGLSVDQMADVAFVTRNTIKAQLRALYRKLDVHSREEAVARIHQAGLLSADS